MNKKELVDAIAKPIVGCRRSGLMSRPKAELEKMYAEGVRLGIIKED